MRGMTLNDFLREYLRKIADGEIKLEAEERPKIQAKVHLRG